MECKQSSNRKKCNCTYEPCSRKGNCCECLAFHLGMGEFPACCFSNKAERSYDRSYSALMRDRG